MAVAFGLVVAFALEFVAEVVGAVLEFVVVEVAVAALEFVVERVVAAWMAVVVSCHLFALEFAGVEVNVVLESAGVGAVVAAAAVEDAVLALVD